MLTVVLKVVLLIVLLILVMILVDNSDINVQLYYPFLLTDINYNNVSTTITKMMMMMMMMMMMLTVLTCVFLQQVNRHMCQLHRHQQKVQYEFIYQGSGKKQIGVSMVAVEIAVDSR